MTFNLRARCHHQPLRLKTKEKLTNQMSENWHLKKPLELELGKLVIDPPTQKETRIGGLIYLTRIWIIISLLIATLALLTCKMEGEENTTSSPSS